MINVIRILLSICLLISLFSIIYFSLDRIRNLNLKNKIEQGLEYLSEQEKTENLKLKYYNYYVSTKKTKIFSSYISYLRKLILISNINSKLKIINPTITIILSIIIGILVGVISYTIILIIPAAIVLGIVGYMVPQITLIFYAQYISNLVDKQLIDYLNLLENFTSIQDDIVFGIKNAIPYSPEPLKTYGEEFVFEVIHGSTPFQALESLGEKVSNPQFKILIKNLKLCNKRIGNYNLIVSKSKELYLKYYKQYLNRKKEATKGMIDILSIAGISIIIFILLLQINPELKNQLRYTSMGQAIVTYNIIVYVITFIIAIRIRKFEY